MSIKERRKELVNEAREKDPVINQARRIMIALAFVLITLRTVHIIFEVIIADETGNYFTVIQNVVVTVIFLGFLSAIISFGFKALTILPIIGSIFSLVKFIPENFEYILAIFQESDIFLMSYVIIFILSALMQGLVMVIFLTHPKCKAYMNVMQDIYNQLYNKYQSPKLN